MEEEQDNEYQGAERKSDPRVVTAERIGETLRRGFLLLSNLNKRKNAAERAFF